jgi:hypothetical protein
MIHSAIALTMAPLFLVSTLLGARSTVMLEAGKAMRPSREMPWLKRLWHNAVAATYVPGEAKPWAKKLARFVLKRDLTPDEIKKMYQWSKFLLTCSIFPKAMNGISYGLSSEQPSIVAEHATEVLMFPLILSQTPFIQNVSFMLYSLFSLGLANDLDNDKLRAKGQETGLRVYPMERLKAIFNPASRLGPEARLKGLGRELAGMGRFVAGDIRLGVQRVVRDFSRILHGQPNEIANGEGNAGKASLGFVLWQVGTIPKLALSFLKNENSPLGVLIKAYSWVVQSVAAVVGDFSLFLLGKDGKTIGERLPMAGATAEASGRILAYGKSERPFATFLQKIGEAGNTLFYAVRASRLKDGDKSP